MVLMISLSLPCATLAAPRDHQDLESPEKKINGMDCMHGGMR